MLSDKNLKAFIPTVDPDKSIMFYRDKLGLKLLTQDDFGIEFAAKGAILRINTVQSLTPHPFTVLGWDVDDIESVIKSLHEIGIKFEKYDFIEQNELGIWTAPGGTKVAWFKDPDGNLLSLSEKEMNEI